MVKKIAGFLDHFLVTSVKEYSSISRIFLNFIWDHKFDASGLYRGSSINDVTVLGEEGSEICDALYDFWEVYKEKAWN
jgi:hypothetical protein